MVCIFNGLSFTSTELTFNAWWFIQAISTFPLVMTRSLRWRRHFMNSWTEEDLGIRNWNFTQWEFPALCGEFCKQNNKNKIQIDRPYALYILLTTLHDCTIFIFPASSFMMRPTIWDSHAGGHVSDVVYDVSRDEQ